MATRLGNGLDLLGSKLQNLGSPSSASDATTKAYVDGLLAGVTSDWHAPARASDAGGNFTTSSAPGVLDGVTLNPGDRLLLKAQTVNSQNGVWVFNGPGSALTRPPGEAFKSGDAIVVAEGSTNDNDWYVLSTNGTITVDTTAQTWVAPPNQTGITRTSLGAAGKYATTIGDGSTTSFTVTHGLGTTDVVVEVRYLGTGAWIITDHAVIDANTISVTFASAPTTGQFRVTVVG